MAVPQFRITVYGERKVAHDIDELANRMVATRPAIEEIYLTILDIEDEIFDSQGARGGDPRWAPVSPQWRKRKTSLGGDPRILHFRHKLRESVTQYRHPDQYVRLERDKIVFGSRLPYARIHQKGEKKFGGERGLALGIKNQQVALGEGVPKREYIKFTDADAKAFAREVSRYIMKAIR